MNRIKLFIFLFLIIFLNLSFSSPKKISRRKITPFSSRNIPSRNFLIMKATAYTPFYCGGRKDGRTATGIKAKRGIVAVDPEVIPLGTKLYIEGYGYAIAADTGGRIKGNRIDLCYDTEKEVKNFGVKRIKVYILNR